MSAGSIQVQSVGPVTNPGFGSEYISASIALTTNQILSVITGLANSNNTINVPTGTACCLIIPPPTNATGITLQGVGTDVGVALSPSQPTVFSPSPGTSFRLLCGGAIAGAQIFFLG